MSSVGIKPTEVMFFIDALNRRDLEIKELSERLDRLHRFLDDFVERRVQEFESLAERIVKLEKPNPHRRPSFVVICDDCQGHGSVAWIVNNDVRKLFCYECNGKGIIR